ncbi:LPD-9 protein [Aphelenchoides avenae]|nr:LPD-9 protein [Aphelenchus avenae]
MSVRCASTGSTGNLDLFKRINKYASEGKWDAINNRPKIALMSKDRRQVLETHQQFVDPDAEIWKKFPAGDWAKLLFRITLGLSCIAAMFKGYELLIPERYRLKYKYRPKEEHH